MILSRVWLTARGTFLRGLGVSPKATPTSSVPRYANVACTIEAQTPRNRAVGPAGMPGKSAKAPGLCQYQNPGASWFGPPPTSKMKQMRISIKMTRALISDIQNSASPKKLTWINCRRCQSDLHCCSTQRLGGRTFTATMARPKTTIHTETLISFLQYCRMIPEAVRLFGNTITYLKK